MTTDFEPDSARRPRWIAWAMLGLLVAAAAILFYGDSFVSGMAGFAALIAIPFALGGLFAFAGDPEGQWPLVGCYVYPTVALLAVCIGAYLFLGEGAVCLIMVVPLWIPAAIGGALVSRIIARVAGRNDRTTLNSVAWLALPFSVLVWEGSVPAEWQDRLVVRSAEIQSSPEQVWPLLISIPDVQASEGRWNLAHDVIGIARPSDARIEERGGTLVRLAKWGPNIRFEERITRLERERFIGWEFYFPDRSIQRFTDQHVSVDGPILKIEKGGYRLEQIGKDRTRVTLTTQYRMRTRLPGYLAFWGDCILGDIQSNVLTIVKDRAEIRQSRLP